jgi:hypothetical protein
VRVDRLEPPREFEAAGVTLRHSANVELETDEQITLVGSSGSEYDIVRKSWGYYATPSTNRRLADHGLRAALTANPDGRISLLLVERGRESEFATYLAEQAMRVVAWLDTDEAATATVERLERR